MLNGLRLWHGGMSLVELIQTTRDSHLLSGMPLTSMPFVSSHDYDGTLNQQ